MQVGAVAVGAFVFVGYLDDHSIVDGACVFGGMIAAIGGLFAGIAAWWLARGYARAIRVVEERSASTLSADDAAYEDALARAARDMRP